MGHGPHNCPGKQAGKHFPVLVYFLSLFTSGLQAFPLLPDASCDNHGGIEARSSHDSRAGLTIRMECTGWQLGGSLSGRDHSTSGDSIIGSIRAESYLATMTAGRRDLPALHSGYLTDEVSVLVAPLRKSSFFVRPVPSLWVPGIFAVEGMAGPGVFFLTPDGRVFAALHPDGSCGLTLDYQTGARVFVDAERLRFGEKLPWTWEGIAYASFGGLSIEASRQRKWDFDEKGRFDESRKGRSGLASIVLGPDWLQVEAAGMDRYKTSMRMAGATVAYIPDILSFGPVIRGRSYRVRTYGSSNEVTDSAFAGGMALQMQFVQLEALYESRRGATSAGELSLSIERKNLTASLSGFAKCGRKVEGRSLRVLRTRPEYETGTTFYLEETSALTLRVRSGFLYLSAGFSRSKNKTDRYATAEFKSEFL